MRKCIKTRQEYIIMH